MSLGEWLLGLLRENGIHHADSCRSRDRFIGPTSMTTGLIDAYTSPAGETTYTCTECRRLATWKAGELQPDPVDELEHALVRGPGEQERADAAVELQRLQRRNAEDENRSGPVEPPQPRGPGRPGGSGLRIPNAEMLIGMFQRLKEASGRPPSQEKLAEALEVGRSTLRDALKRFDLRWPPE